MPDDRDSPTGRGADVHVGRTYDRIARHFSQTREYAWPEVEAFLDGRRSGTALDLGCGNGRHAEVLADHADRVVGVDASRGLLAEARDRAVDRGYTDRLDLLVGDAAAVPLSAGTVGLAVYVATLHHLRSRERRVASLDDLARVLSADGRGLVSAWSTAHSRFEDAGPEDDVGFDTEVEWTLPGGETVPRFYHIYAPAEFERDLSDSRLAVVDSFVSSGNCYAVVERA